jgi:hypothetical protein
MIGRTLRRKGDLPEWTFRLSLGWKALNKGYGFGRRKGKGGFARGSGEKSTNSEIERRLFVEKRAADFFFSGSNAQRSVKALEGLVDNDDRRNP